jgi:translocation and assembly module TamB
VLRWGVGAIVAAAVLVGAVLLLLDTGLGHRWIADRIGRVETDN